jgi:hypothetical protein
VKTGGPAKSSGDEVVLWVAASGEVWNSGPRQVVGAANGLPEAVELAAAAAAGNLCQTSAS